MIKKKIKKKKGLVLIVRINYVKKVEDFNIFFLFNKKKKSNL